jgi:integrase
MAAAAASLRIRLPTSTGSRQGGRPIEPGNANEAFNRRCNWAGVRRIKIHDSRRTSGSLLAAPDVHPRVAIAILRHSKIALTMEICTQVPDKVTREALRLLSDQLDQAHDVPPGEALPG